MSLSGKSRASQDYQENYFDIDDILATHQRVPCRFEQQIYNLGYLEAGSDNEHILANTRMELPLWMAQYLFGRKRNFVSIEIPRPYREGYREILSAEASVVDLHKLGPYYYTLGTLLLPFGHVESPDIAVSLLKAFQKRFRTIMDTSQNAFNEDLAKLTEKLDETERTIFQCGQQGLNDFVRWQSGETQKITTSDMVINHKKRKRAAMDS